MQNHRHLKTWTLGAVLVIGGGAALAAQGRDDTAGSRAILALTTGLRQLRIAVEELARSQAQTQALSTLAVVQLGRVGQVSTRLDAARREMEAAGERGKAIATEVARLSAERRQVTDTTRRAQIDAAIDRLVVEQAAVFEREQAGDRRASDLARLLQAEESRWTEALDRLEHTGR